MSYGRRVHSEKVWACNSDTMIRDKVVVCVMGEIVSYGSLLHFNKVW